VGIYLLNPSGVLFGPNASLDISGSFHVSTADYLRLADGARFFARLSDTSTLSVAPPVAFGFLGPTPAAITVQGSTLEVPEGHTLSVIGGDAQIVGGTLRAPSGRIQLASVAAAGEVRPGTAGQTPELQVDSFARLGRLELAQNALIDASGTSRGTVLIRSGRLLVDQSSIRADTLGSANGARQGIDIAVTEEIRNTQGVITASSSGIGDAGDIRVAAGSVHMDGALIGAGTFGAGRAGVVTMEVGSLTLANGARIDSSTFGPGPGGTVRVSAAETVTLTGTTPDGRFPSGLFATAQGVGAQAGDAGTVVVAARNIQATAGAQLSSSSFGAGRGGTVQVSAAETITLTGTAPDGPPSGIFASPGQREAPAGEGGIVVQARNVTLTDGAQMSSTSRLGRGGTVTVTATEAPSPGAQVSDIHRVSVPPVPEAVEARRARIDRSARRH
jgi:large exoprotein involved in heme utilization and adhesion